MMYTVYCVYYTILIIPIKAFTPKKNNRLFKNARPALGGNPSNRLVKLPSSKHAASLEPDFATPKK